MIEAKIIADSIGPTNVRITTWELTYPRFIHAEFMTHRVFSRNAASSRAIPIKSMIAMIRDNPAMPVHWGKNQPGMQANTQLEGAELESAKATWLQAVNLACEYSEGLADIGVHKQIANRITEFAQHMKVVMTSTELNNWFWLRDHTDAQPEIHELASKMKEVYDASTPQYLHAGMSHVPYVKSQIHIDAPTQVSIQYFIDENDKYIPLSEALMISVSCCAQVSYRKSDASLEKAETIYKRLIESEPAHSSPTEHQAVAFDYEDDWGYNKPFEPDTWLSGITHVDQEGNLWSGNLRGWVQYRQVIPNNVRKG